MAEAFVRSPKCDYVPVSPAPDARSVLQQLSSWIAYCTTVHPHRRLVYRSPRGYISRLIQEAYQAFKGAPTPANLAEGFGNIKWHYARATPARGSSAETRAMTARR